MGALMTAFEDHNPTVHIARVHPELGHTIPWPKRMTEGGGRH